LTPRRAVWETSDVRLPAHLFLLLAVLSACGNPARVTSDGGTFPDGGAGDAGVDLADLAPHRWPAEPGVRATHDVDLDLWAVLEPGVLNGACAAVDAGTADEATRLRCGKWMFFYETFGTVGIPQPLLDFLQKHYADYYGAGFSQMGFIPDPASTKGMPLGLYGPAGKLQGVNTAAFTCAACHFGRMPDGRYAAGYANHSLQYGRFLAGIGAPMTLSTNANSDKVAPALRAELLPHVNAAKARSGTYMAEMGWLGLQLTPVLLQGTNVDLTVAEQELFLELPGGTLDFMFKPLLDDGYWTVSRAVALWNMPSASQRAAAGMPHEMLALNGGVPRLMDFLHGFVAIGVSKNEWTDARLKPLEDYVRSLRAPAPLTPPDEGAVRAGARLFVQKGCLECHDGPTGESSRAYAFTEVGTDDAYAHLYNPDAAGNGCCNVPPEAITRGVKAPRMAGLFAQGGMLHNGSVRSLEQLFCLEPRNPTATPALTSKGHPQSCDGLTVAEKQSLMVYLRSL
jgi:hypothetical protein